MWIVNLQTNAVAGKQGKSKTGYNGGVKWVAVFLLLMPFVSEAEDLMKELDQVEVWLRGTEYEKALSSAKKIAAEAKKSKNDKALARAYYVISDAQYYLGNPKAFKHFAQEAVNAYLKINDATGIAKSYYQLSFIYEQDQPEEMLRVLDKANEYAEKANELWLRAVIRNAYGLAYQNQGDYRQAASNFEASAKIAEQAEDEPKQAIALSNAGLNFSYLGDYQKALTYFNRALSLSKKVNNKRSLAVVLGQRGLIQLTLGDTDDALSCFREVLALHEESGYRQGQIRQLQNIADVHRQLRETDKFLKFSRKALAIAEEAEQKWAIFYTLNRIAEILIDDDRLSEAEPYLARAQAMEMQAGQEMSFITRARLQLKLSNFSEAHKTVEAALAIAKGIEDFYSLGKVYSTEARIFEAEGKFPEAIDAYRKSVDLYEPMGILRELAFWCGRIAELNARIGNKNEAEKYYQKSLAYVNKLDSILIMDRFRINLFQDVSDIYQSYARWLASQGLIEQAWNILEQGRARDLTLRITQALDTVSLTPKEQDALGRLSILQRSLREEELSKSERTEVLDKISLAETQYEQAVFHAESAKSSSRTPYKLHFPERDSLFIEYAVHGNELLIFSQRNGSIKFRKVAPAQPILDKTIALYQQASRFTQKMDDTDASRELFSVLLEPELQNVKGGRIIVVPDDVLNFLPFAALKGKDGKYLSQSYAISTAPSLEILSRLYERNSSLEDKAAAIANTNFLFSKHSPFPLPSLPGAEREARMLTRNVSGTILMLNENESRIKKMDFSRFQLMHFATHTLINESQPERSCIVLGSDSDEDGYLQAREIYRMRLGKMIVLSGCRSGTGKIVSGEGLVGLSHALFASGARTLVASLWDISDEGTVEFMKAFYGSLSGRSVAEALQKAQNRMIDSGKWNHPGYWSGFFVSGVSAQEVRISPPESYAWAYYSGIAVFLIAAVFMYFKTHRKGPESLR